MDKIILPCCRDNFHRNFAGPCWDLADVNWHSMLLVNVVVRYKVTDVTKLVFGQVFAIVCPNNDTRLKITHVGPKVKHKR